MSTNINMASCSTLFKLMPPPSKEHSRHFARANIKYRLYSQCWISDIWTDGTDIYAWDMVFNKEASKWDIKIWHGLEGRTYPQGRFVWTDGTDMYYSDDTGHYILDKTTSTWKPKTWYGHTTFGGTHIWTDGTNVYYSNWNHQYVLNKSTSTWEPKTWAGLKSFYKSYIWTDGINIYYSNGAETGNYILNKSTSTWEPKTWTGLTTFYASSIWTDKNNTYYSYNSDQYVLNKSTSTWEPKTWSGLTSVDGSYVWTDGTNVYHTDSSLTYSTYLLDKETSTWVDKGVFKYADWTAFNSAHIWTDGINIYYSDGTETGNYVFYKELSAWGGKTWKGLTAFYGTDIWTDGTNVYYSHDTDHYVLNKITSTWEPRTWTGVTSFQGRSIWTDGTNIYCTPECTGYELDDYYVTYILDTQTSHWSLKHGWTINIKDTTSGAIHGEYIWSDGTDVYCSYFFRQYILNKTTSTWEAKAWNGSCTGPYGKQVWSDGTKIYTSTYGYGSNHVLDKNTSTWTAVEWRDPDKPSEYLNPQSVWSDGTNTYLSYTSGRHFVFNKEDCIWEPKTWNGYTAFGSGHIWTDGTNVYCSNGAEQYVLNKSTSTWETKTWSGIPTPSAEFIWTDGTNIYHSSGTEHYILNKTTSTWEAKTWTGLESFIAKNVWSDNDGVVYYSEGKTQYVLNKSASTWEVKDWDLALFLGRNCIWTDGTDIYYRNKRKTPTDLKFDKSTDSWSAVGSIPMNHLYEGADIWRAGSVAYSPDDDYYFYGFRQYKIQHGGSSVKRMAFTQDLSFDINNIWTDGTNVYCTIFNGSEKHDYVLMPRDSMSSIYMRVDDEWCKYVKATEITFTINSGTTVDSPVYTECTAREGMTWGEYVYSSLNDKTFYDSEAKMTVTDRYIGIGSPYNVYLHKGETMIKVLATETIVAGETYTLAGK